MANRKYSEEFRNEAVRQITKRGCSVIDVSKRLGHGCRTFASCQTTLIPEFDSSTYEFFERIDRIVRETRG